jgi:coenzyme F420-reducing hydrogenase delta subunit
MTEKKSKKKMPKPGVKAKSKPKTKPKAIPKKSQKKPAKKAAKPQKARLPRIIMFACNWCSYAGADLAGVSRLQYPPTQRIIRVMCSGRITPAFVLDALTGGADGVIVSGCHFEDCHYISGSRKAEKVIEETKKLMHLLGIDQRRLRFELISAAEGQKFAEVAREFTAQINTLNNEKHSKKQ